MQTINSTFKKNKNLQREEYFHDEWAKGVSVSEIDPFKQFKGETSPEYREVARIMGGVKGLKILNLGCGLGEEAVYFAHKGAKVYAIDISKEMLKFTKDIARKYKVEKNISFHHMSVEDLKFSDEVFDRVVGCNILHHVNIEKTIKEVKRVLKPNGVSVFSEPLAYNPVVNIYRAMADKVRTDDEHPLTYGEFEKIRKEFPRISHVEFQLFTLLIFVWFFLGERLHPNKVRYWKKIIIDANKYRKIFGILQTIDSVILSVFPFLKKYCWVTVITVVKN